MLFNSNTILFLWGYKPNTQPAIKWKQLANGNWRASDRGVNQDVFKSSVTFRGPESELIDLESSLNNGRGDFAINCGTGEEIFGADLDYTGDLLVAVTKYGKISRVAYDAFAMNLELRLVTTPPTFKSVSASLGDLRTARFQWDQYSEYTITKHFTYDNDALYLDHETDPGFFKCNFTQTQTEAEKIRRYLLTTGRTASIVFPSIGGVDYPFGTREGTGPFNCRIIEWKDLGRPNLIDWNYSITFAREFA